ncbi:MAG: Gfo/Idh/MocA family oxidoreductase [Clostridia bacterium]|nr:Gfo/Idh/MocA family oxidoreductase [Clostridia bacterium]
MKKIGIIGYGNMGSWHAENITARIKDLTVSGIYDIDPARCAAAEQNGFKNYPTAEALLESGIDIVLIATPNDLHKSYSVMAMEAGVNVVCEKPACLNEKELDEVLETSRRTGKFYTVHQNRRFDPDFRVVKEIIDQKLVGNTLSVESRLYNSRGCSTAWRSTYSAGGGALYDWGIHMIDQALNLIDSRPVSVYAYLKKQVYSEVDDGGKLIITFENKVRFEIAFDFWCYISEPRWRVLGDDGTACVPEWFSAEGEIIKANKNIELEKGCVYTPNGISTTMWPRPKQNIQQLSAPKLEAEPCWEEFYENVIDVLEGRAEPLVTHEQITAALKVMLAAFRSSETNRVIII